MLTIELVVRMKTLTSITGIKGFTLIELLIVLLIIGVLASFTTLSINTVRPSESQILFKNLQNQLSQSQKIAQLKNVNLRLNINNKRSMIEQLEPETQMWINLPKTQPLQWQNIALAPSESIIYISPNGQTTSFFLKISDGNESYLLEVK